MTRTITWLALPAILALGACRAKEQGSGEAAQAAMTATAESLPPVVAQAVALAKALEANPMAADSVLAANGMTRAGLDSLMYTIAADSALSAAYTKALQ